MTTHTTPEPTNQPSKEWIQKMATKEDGHNTTAGDMPTPDDQPLTPTPDTARDLTDLWNAMGEAGIVTKIWPHEGRYWYIGGQAINDAPIQDCDALDILTGHAERWLRGRGWYPEESWGRYYHPAQEGWRRRTNLSLPAAIRAECGRGK